MAETVKHTPNRIRVAQDSEGFWTCREAVSGSQEYVRADLADEMLEALRAVTAALVATTSLIIRAEDEKCRPSKAAPSDAMFAQMLKDYDAATQEARAAIAKATGDAQ